MSNILIISKHLKNFLSDAANTNLENSKTNWLQVIASNFSCQIQEEYLKKCFILNCFYLFFVGLFDCILPRSATSGLLLLHNVVLDSLPCVGSLCGGSFHVSRARLFNPFECDGCNVRTTRQTGRDNETGKCGDCFARWGA